MTEITQISHYHSTDTMSMLIERNIHMLRVLSRFGIRLGFAGKTIAEVCRENEVECNTFLAVTNLILTGDKSDHIHYSSISINSLHGYLLNSHKHYIEWLLPGIKMKIELAKEKLGEKEATLLARYYEQYISETTEHLQYEEEKVFPYVVRLVTGTQEDDFCIEQFAQHHYHTEAKLVELRNIITMYMDTESSTAVCDMIYSIDDLATDLRYHAMVEDALYIPLIKEIESCARE